MDCCSGAKSADRKVELVIICGGGGGASKS